MQTIIEDLEKSITSNDPNVVEEAVYAAYQHGLDSSFSGVFQQLLLLDWHTRHEDLVQGLQQLRPPQAVDAIHKTATIAFPYLDYDDSFGLARKCTWALADIGTDYAREKLVDLAQSSNAQIAAYAQKRLDNWQAEVSRKGI